MERFRPESPARSGKEIVVIVVTTDVEQDWGLGRGYRVVATPPGQLAGFSTPDVYLVDVMDGPELGIVGELARGGSQAVVVFGPAGHPDAIRYLDLGAADYVTARMSAEERLARVRAAARRNGVQPANARDEVRIGALSISVDRHEVRKNGELVLLTPHEFDVLAALLQTPDELVPHRKLMVRVWGAQNSSSRHYLRIYIRQLRKKLEPDPEAPTVILTERGRGYLIRTDGVARKELSA